MSPKSTSALSPSETKCENPMLRLFAQSNMAVASAPDCVTKASLPGKALPGEKLAFSDTPVTKAPMQFGPNTRSKCGRAAASMFCSRVRPLAVMAFKPALSTMAARVPLCPSADSSSGTVSAGVQMTAKSGAKGNEFTSGQAGSPSTCACLALTGQIGPLKPPNLRLCKTTDPKLPSRSEAPMRATEVG